jgi:hypothetical protein
MLGQQAVAYPTLSEEGLLVRPSLSHFRRLFCATRKRHFPATVCPWQFDFRQVVYVEKEFGGRVVGKRGKVRKLFSLLKPCF